MFDFPNTPTVGQQATTPSGAVLEWDGVKWIGAGSVRNVARLQAQWVGTSVVSNDTVWLCYDTPYAGTVNSLLYFTGNGNFTVAVQINDVSVGGMGAISVNLPTPTTVTASGATFPIHSKITAVITGATSSPTDALLSLAVTWS